MGQFTEIPDAFKHITELWAWVAVDLQGEGVMAHETIFDGTRLMMPLVGADRERMRSLEPLARSIVDSTGVAATLVQFTTRTEHETIEARPGRG